MKFPSTDDLYDIPAKARDRLTERAGIFIVDPDAGRVATSASAAIQSKIGKASAFGGGKVLIPPGVYPIGASLSVPSNVTIQGAGRGATILRNMAGVNASVIKQSTTGTSKAGLRDMTVDGNMAQQTIGFSVIRIDTGTHWLMDGLEVMGAKRVEPDELGGGECIELVKGGRHKISNCYVHDTDYDGVKLRTSHYNVITNLHAHNCGKSGVQFAFARDLGEDGFPSEWNQVIGLTVTHDTGIPGSFSPSTTGLTFHAAADNVISGLVVDGTQFLFNAAATNARNSVTGVDARVQNVTDFDSAMLDLSRATVVNGRVRGSNGYVAPVVVAFSGDGTLRQSGSDLIWRVGGVDQNLTP